MTWRAGIIRPWAWQGQKHKEAVARAAHRVLHTELELPKNQRWYNNLLTRCILMMGTVLHDSTAPERIIAAGGLGLVEACLDCPIEDTHGAAANLLGNLASLGRQYVAPGHFADPRHVVHALCRVCGWYVMDGAGGSSTTTTCPTLNFLLLCASARAFTLKVSHAPISIECLFSMTLLRGEASQQDVHGGAACMVPASASSTCEPSFLELLSSVTSYDVASVTFPGPGPWCASAPCRCCAPRRGGGGRYLPRHHPHIRPSFLELKDIL